MALQTAQIAVGTTPVELTVFDLGDSGLLVKAPETSDLYIGGADVTTTTGYLVSAGSSIGLDLTGERVYGVLASGSSTVHILRTGI